MSKGAIVLSAVPSIVGATLGQMIEHDHDKNIIIYCGSGSAGVVGLTAMAYSTHIHGSPAITGSISITSLSNALSISIPNFLTTAAESDHTHSDYLALSDSTLFATSYLVSTFITTAPALTHTHDYAGTGFTGTGVVGTLNSNGLAIEVTGATGGADGYNILAAGTQTANTATTVLLANSNNVTFGMSAGSRITMSFSESTHAHPYLSSISSSYFIPVSSSSVFLTTAALSDHTHDYAGTSTAGTNVGLTVNSDGIRASIDTAGMTALGDGANFIAAGSQTAGTLETIVFANSNDFTFGMSASSQVTASFSQSTHDHPYVETASSSLLQHTSATSEITSLAMNTSQQSDYFYTSANTFANSTHTHGDISTASTTGSDIQYTSSSSGLTLGIPQYLTTYASQSDQQRVISLNGTTGELSLSGASNITVSALNGSTITIYGPSNILNSFSIGGNTGTTNSSAITGGGFLFAGGDNVTLSQSNNSISIHGASGGIRLGGSDTTYTSGTVMLSGEANVTVGTTEIGGIQYLKLSAAGATNTAGADGYNWIVAGTQTANTTGYVSFADSNGIIFGMSNSSIVTASHNALTTQLAQAVSGSNGSFSFETLSFGDLNGLSFYTSNNSLVGSYTVPSTFSQSEQPLYYAASGTTTNASTIPFGNTNGISFSLSNDSIVGTVATDYMASNKSSDFAGTGFTSTSITGSNILGTLNTGGLSVEIPNYLTTAMLSNASSAFAGTGFTSATTTGTRIDAILETNGLSLVYPRILTTAMESDAGSRFIGTATAQTNVTWTVNSNGISFNAGAYAKTGFTTASITGSNITGYHNTAGLYLSIPNYLTTVATGLYAGTGFTTGSTGGTGIVGTLNSIGLSMRVPSYVNQSETGAVYFVNTSCSNITFGSTNSSNSTYIYATAGSQTASIVFTNANGVSFLTSTSGSTTTISASVETAYFPVASSTKFPQAWEISGNTAGTSSHDHFVNSSVLRLHAGNNITLSGGDTGISIIGGAGLAALGNTANSSAFTSGSVMFSGSNITVNTSITGGSQYLQIQAPAMGYLYFSNANGHSWSSSTDGVSTSVYVVTA